MQNIIGCYFHLFISKHLFSGYKLYFIIYIDKYIHIHSHICIICKHLGHTCKKQKENNTRKVKIKWRQSWVDLRSRSIISGFGVAEKSIKMFQKKIWLKHNQKISHLDCSWNLTLIRYTWSASLHINLTFFILLGTLPIKNLRF